MKIAILGSAPSSIQKAPFGDQSWKIWACSPGAYPVLARIDEFWEVHRWEPGVVGKPQTQKPWFTPEYVAWLKSVPPVLWVTDPAAARECPNAKKLPWEALEEKYGSYVWTSSVAYMTAMAIERILEQRAERERRVVAEREAEQARIAAGGAVADVLVKECAPEPDVIGFWGIDMAANEELYSAQRSACQFFIQVIVGLGIEFFIPPESDLATPPPKYGVCETTHQYIKLTERKRELEARKAQTDAQLESLRAQHFHLAGALDDLHYNMTMWSFGPDVDTNRFDFERVFPELVVGRDAMARKKIEPVAAEKVMDAEASAAQAAPAQEATPVSTLQSTPRLP